MAKGDLLARIRRFRCLKCDLLFGVWEPPADCERCHSAALVNFDAVPLRLLGDYRRGLAKLPELLGRYGAGADDITTNNVIGDRRK